MKIANWMTTPVVTVKPLDSAAHARALMEKHRVNQLPVVVDHHLIGIVTDRDLRDAFPSLLDVLGVERLHEKKTFTTPEEIPVEWVMTANPLTLTPEDRVEVAANAMRKERIGAVPIVEKRRLVGILTRSDVLEAFCGLSERVSASGARQAVAPPQVSEEIRRNW